MRIPEEFPCRFTEPEDCWIPLPDGVRLAARLWLPESAHEKPVPPIPEVLPYQTHDQPPPPTAPAHRYFAHHGYASIRPATRAPGRPGGEERRGGREEYDRA